MTAGQQAGQVKTMKVYQARFVWSGEDYAQGVAKLADDLTDLLEQFDADFARKAESYLGSHNHAIACRIVQEVERLRGGWNQGPHNTNNRCD